ncbi:major tail protein [Orenia marismortui]|uniref:Phi13 family phage major tail protein n=1 Tax=Orenia marismortui TaxID=46469 RepID=A0A4R8H1Q4_9FIRM|nr:major tail protein [Orenia marismortui]TDX52139.1 phi13 family phage major tail protein [Orenia marismortui]
MSNKVKFGLEKVHIAFKGVSQTKSIEVTDPPGTDGEITVTVTADSLLGISSPVSVVVPLATETHDSVAKVASAIVNALNNDSDINSVFYARHEGGKIYLWTKVAQTNDATLDITFADTGTTGATMGTAQDVTSGTTGWGTPEHIPGVVGFSTSPEGDTTEFYADNTKYFTYTTNNGYTGDLEQALIPRDVLAEMLGQVIDNNGMLVESANDNSKEFALMFQVQGDKKNRRLVYYRCQADRPSEDNNTSESSVTPTTDTLNLTMLPTEDDNKYVKGTLELADDNSNQAAYDGFFDAVLLPNIA